MLIQQQEVENHNKIHISMTHLHQMNKSACGLALQMTSVFTAMHSGRFDKKGVIICCILCIMIANYICYNLISIENLKYT